MADDTTAKFFTRARRIPQLIGKMPDGTRIPGGPYTMPEVISVGLVLFLGKATMPLWGIGAWWMNYAVLVGVAVATFFAVRKFPAGGRSPLIVIGSGIGLLMRTSAGNHRGAPVRELRPHPVRGRLYIEPSPDQLHPLEDLDELDEQYEHEHDDEQVTVPAVGDPLPAEPVVIDPEPNPVLVPQPLPRPAMSNVQRILAGATPRS